MKRETRFAYYKLVLPILSLGVAVIGILLVTRATNWGPWAFSDSAAYISSARNFNLGLGLTLRNAYGILEPLDVFPPLYPLTLGILARMGLEYLVAARGIDIIFYGLFLVIYCGGIYSVSRNIWEAFFASLLAVFSPFMIEHFSGIMTEPPFFVISYGAIFSTLHYIQTKRKAWFITSIVLTSITPLMKHIGLVTYAVNTLVILFLDDKKGKKRVLQAVLFGSLTLLPILAWFGFTYAHNQTLGGRSLDLSPDVWNRFQSFIAKTSSIFQTWVPYSGYKINWIPDSTKVALAIIILMALLITGWVLYLRKKNNPPAINDPKVRLVIVSVLIIVVHLTAFCLIQIFTYPKMDLIGRFFIPILPAIILLAVSSSFLLIQQISLRWRKIVAIILSATGVLLIRYYFLVSNAFVNERAVNGYGYTAREIQTSGFIQAIDKIPTDTTLIANTPALTLLYTNRMPYSVDFIATVPFGSRDLEIDRLFTTRQAALILDYASIRNVYPDWKERLAYFTNGLNMAFQDEIGGIYYSPK